MAAVAAFAGAATAPAAAQPAPFGHACVPLHGVRVCPTALDSQRVPSWDGVPLDVDVTLPPAGEGPFPTIVMHHGFGGRKEDFQATDPQGAQPGGRAGPPTLVHRNNVFYARRGYAVVNYSARGFGRSCGARDSRTTGCERGWLHVVDQRFEARDTQHLLGMLVDQGVARPGALGVVGESQGAITSLQLAFLRNRVRLPDGRFAAWRSPAGRRLGISAAFTTWTGHDVVAALAPNGRLLDFRPAAPESLTPPGIANNGNIDGLLALARGVGHVAPRGADPTADLERWNEVIQRGEPYGPAARAIARELGNYHSASRLTGVPAPLLVQNGWSDDLFGIGEAIRLYNALRSRNPAALIALQLLDTGHARGGRHPNQERAANDQAAAFLAAYLLRRGRPPRAGSVLAYTQACPRDAPGGVRIGAASYARLHPGAVVMGAARRQTVTSDGGDPELARRFTPNFGTSDACTTAPAAPAAPGTAVITRRVGAGGFTLLGRPTLEATIAARGPFGQLDSRLWDVDPATRTQQLVTRGAYRLTPGQRGRILLQLNGGAYRFPPGHVVKLELLGRDAPFLRASNGSFAVDVAAVRVELPVREGPSRARGIARPRFLVDPVGSTG